MLVGLALVIAGAAAGGGVATTAAQSSGGETPSPVVIRETEAGFDWGDAAIGAAAAVATLLLVVGLVLTVRTERRR